MTSPAATPSQPRAGLSLRAKICALSTLSCAAASLLLALLCGQLQAQRLRESSRELQMTLVQDIAQHTRLHLEQTQRELSALARVISDRELGADAQLVVIKALLESSAYLDHVDLFDAQGAWIDRVRTQGPARPPSLQLGPLAQEKALHRGIWVAPAHLAGDAPTQGWVLPLKENRDGKLTGFMASQVPLAPIEARLRSLAAQHLPGVEHALYLRSNEGLVIASSHPVERQGQVDRMLADLDLAALPQDVGVAQDVNDCPQGPQGCDSKVLGTVLRMSSRPWVIVAKIPAPVAYAPLYALRKQLALAVIGSVTLTMLISFFLARHMTAPLGALVQMAQRLTKHRFDHTGLLHRGDELGQLARALSQTVQELQISDASRYKGTREDEPIPSQTKPERASTRFSPDLPGS